MRIRKNRSPHENVHSLLSAMDRQAAAPDSEFLKQLRERCVAEFTARGPHASAKTPKSILITAWRIAMKNPMTKFAVAAIVAIACVIGLSLWRGTGSGIALADVLARIEQVTTYTYQMRSEMTRGQATSEWTSNVLVSNEHGIKITVTSADSNSVQSEPRPYSPTVGDETYLLPRSSSMVFISHKDKTYDRFVYDGVKLDYYKEEYNEPHTIIKQILSCKHTSLGQSIIDGVTVEGFQTIDLAYTGGFFGQDDYYVGDYTEVHVKLWVGVETFLPMRLEEDIVTEEGAHIREISYDFRWNVVISQKDFVPDIPEEYRTPDGDIVIKPFNEENAIKGWRLWASAFGKYPGHLETIGQDYREAAGVDPNAMKALYEAMSDEERTRKTSEVMEMIAPGLLYSSLVAESRDPTYYGETVQPGEVDKVLLRWRLDDGRYRVIFGDLSASTVTSDQLTKLEAP